MLELLYELTIKKKEIEAQLKAINEEKEDRTIVLVSHRQSTMRIVDNVYCVEHGRIS